MIDSQVHKNIKNGQQITWIWSVLVLLNMTIDMTTSKDIVDLARFCLCSNNS